VVVMVVADAEHRSEVVTDLATRRGGDATEQDHASADAGRRQASGDAGTASGCGTADGRSTERRHCRGLAGELVPERATKCVEDSAYRQLASAPRE
jgi:hypothetical protein